MKRLLKLLLPVAVIALLLVAVTAWGKQSGKSHKKGGKVVTVIEHATTDATTDTGASGDSAGDVLTFANDVFNAKDTKKGRLPPNLCVLVPSRFSYAFSTSMNASCGMFTEPMDFIRFLPSFCFSSSLRLRVISPP